MIDRPLVSSQLTPSWRMAWRLISAILTCKSTWRGPGTTTRLMITKPPIGATAHAAAAHRRPCHRRPSPAAAHRSTGRRPWPHHRRPCRHPMPPPPVMRIPPLNPDNVLHDLKDVGHHLGVWYLAIEDDLCAHLADLHLRSGKGLVDARFELLGVEAHAHQERNGTIGVVPERQAGVAEGSAVHVQQARVGLIGQQLDVGDRRVRDVHPGERPFRLNDLRLSHHHRDFRFGVLDQLDHVGHVPGHLGIGSARSWSGRTAGNQSGGVAAEVDHLRAGLQRRFTLRRQRLDRNDPGNVLARQRRRRYLSLPGKRRRHVLPGFQVRRRQRRHRIGGLASDRGCRRRRLSSLRLRAGKHGGGRRYRDHFSVRRRILRSRAGREEQSGDGHG